jgi:hypothetical protein
MWSKSSGMQKVAMILSSMVDLRVRGGIVPAHTGRLDKVASWVLEYPRYGLIRIDEADALLAELRSLMQEAGE